MDSEIRIRNLDKTYSDILRDSTNELQQYFGSSVSVSAHFDRDHKGLFHGRIQVVSKWGAAYAIGESRSVFQLANALRQKLKSQLNRKRNVDKASRRKLSQNSIYSLSSDNFKLPEIQTNWISNNPVPFYPEPIIPEINNMKQAKVLIIDDDIESILAVDNIFKNLGCLTFHALDPYEATKKITSGKADVIILDWNVGTSTGADIINKSLEKISKFESLVHQVEEKNPKIVTYSGTSAKNLYIPKNNLFEHYEHWQKPMRHHEVSLRTSNILNQIGF